MLLDENTHPERKIYYLGAMVLEILNKSSANKLAMLDIYQELNYCSKIKCSATLYALALDWLFILGAIDSENGSVKKCF